MTKKMRKAHSAVNLPIEGEGSKVSSTVFPHRSHVMTSVAETPATGKNISKPSRPMVVVAKRAAPLNPVQQSQYKKLRFVPPEYQAELRNWVKDSSPMYRTPLRGTIAPLQQQSGTFNTSSAIGRTPPVDMMHRESAYSKAQSAQGATKMARKKKMEDGAGYAPSGASAEEILFGSLGGAPVKKRSMAPPKPPTPPKMPPPFPPGGGSGKRPPVPMPTPGQGGQYGGINPGGMYTGRPKNPTAKPSMGMGKMSKANRLPGMDGKRPAPYPMIGKPPRGDTRPPSERGMNPTQPPRISKPPYKPAPDMSTMPVDRPKQTGPGKSYPLPRNPVSPDGKYGSPTPTEPPRSGAGGKYRDGGMGSVNKADGQGAFINGKLAPQSHSLTKSASCPNCGGKMSKGMCKGMCKGMMHKGDGHKVDKKLVMFNTNKGMMNSGMMSKKVPISARQGERVIISGDDQGNMKTAPKGAYLDMLSRASGKTRGFGARKMAKSARMCKCGSGMSKSMCKCGM